MGKKAYRCFIDYRLTIVLGMADNEFVMTFRPAIWESHGASRDVASGHTYSTCLIWAILRIIPTWFSASRISHSME